MRRKRRLEERRRRRRRRGRRLRRLAPALLMQRHQRAAQAGQHRPTLGHGARESHPGRQVQEGRAVCGAHTRGGVSVAPHPVSSSGWPRRGNVAVKADNGRSGRQLQAINREWENGKRSLHLAKPLAKHPYHNLFCKLSPQSNMASALHQTQN